MLRKRIDEAREQGFTLIELLIVIVVLGLLAGIVTLGVTKFTADAKAATCKATTDNIQIATDAYLAQNPTGTPTQALVDDYLKDATWPTGYSATWSGSTVTVTCPA